MLTPNDIGDALEALLLERFPGEKVHRELCPTGFTRPCNLIVQGKCVGNANFGTGLVELRPSFTITTFVPTDEYHHSHLAGLHGRQMAIVGLLLPGYIRVGERAPKVLSLELDGEYDYDEVKVTFSYTLSRKDFIEQEPVQKMGEFHFRQEVT